MKALFTALLFVSTVTLSACGQRKVEVQTGPMPAENISLHFTNNTNSAVNVYVVNAGNRIFVGQVSSNSTQHLNVSGVASGSVVRLEASTVGGQSQTYSKDNVSLSGMYSWQIP